ncbi:pericentrin isoform X2 [Magallana gigas]|uniref:pericentrin isoform X2 n=1 Tax=Magallana gigas TaxID=29159 RepID=UPI00333FED2A
MDTELKVQFMSRVWRNLSRTSSQHHNFVSRLMEEKMELRNTLGHLEEEIWRYRQRGAEQQIQRLYGKYLWADSYRKALVYQKKYMLLLLGGFQDCEQTTLALNTRMGVDPFPEDLQRRARLRQPVTTFRSAVRWWWP